MPDGIGNKQLWNQPVIGNYELRDNFSRFRQDIGTVGPQPLDILAFQALYGLELNSEMKAIININGSNRSCSISNNL